MLNIYGLVTVIPVILILLAIYAFFSIAVDVRAIRRLLEQQAQDRDVRMP